MISQNKNTNWLTRNTREPFLPEITINPTIHEEPKKVQRNKNGYRRFQIPPDISICNLHQLATSFGINSEQNSTKCPCCNQNVKKLIKFNSNVSDIYKINEPVGYYFTFIKMMLLALFFLIVFPGIYSIVKITENCQNQHTDCDYIFGIPFPKLEAYYTVVTLSLNAFILVIMYIILTFLFYWNVFIHEKMRFIHKKAADQHVFLSGLDHQKIQQRHIMDQLKQFSIEQIIYTHKVNKYLKLCERKTKIQAMKRKYNKENKVNKVNKLNTELRKIDNELVPMKNNIEMGNDKFLRTDKIFIRFSNNYEKNRFEKTYKKGIWSNIVSLICTQSSLKISNCEIFVQRLGDPRQIIWQNLQIPSIKRYLLILLNNVLMLVILAISFYIVLELTTSEKQYQQSDIILSVVISVLIQLLNFILGKFIDFTTEKEGRYTVTGVTSAKLIKKTLVYFVNTTLIPFSMFIFKQFKPVQQNQMQNVLTIFIFCNLISPFMEQYLQKQYFTKLYSRYKIKKQGKQCLISQIQGNLIFEKKDFNLEDRYGVLCQRLMNCMFYAAIFPAGAIITGFGLILTYFLSKYQLLSNCSIPRHSFRLGILITQIAALFPCIYGFGYVANLYIYQQTPTYNTLFSIIMAVCTVPVSFIYIFFATRIAKRCINIQASDISSIYVTQQVTYKDLNPTSFINGDDNSDKGRLSKAILVNLARYSVFRQGLNFSRLSKSALSSGIKELIKEQSQEE